PAPALDCSESDDNPCSPLRLLPYWARGACALSTLSTQPVEYLASGTAPAAARRSFSDRARACTETRPPCREGSMPRGFLERTGAEMEYQRFNAAKEFPCEKRSSACPVGLVSIRFPLIPSPGGLGTGPRAGRDC